jgi:hypothetical protein
MKFRQGFVSNSSSCSFLIYGAHVNDYDEEKVDELEDWAYKNNYAIEFPEYMGLYIGKSWSSVKDDETGKQFKEKIEKDLKKLGFNEFNTFSYAWYNG